MRKSRFSEEQIIGVLKEQQAGLPVAELCRKHGIGYRRLHILLWRDGVVLNHKKLFRLYREERLTVRRRGGRKRALGARAPMTLPRRAGAALIETTTIFEPAVCVVAEEVGGADGAICPRRRLILVVQIAKRKRVRLREVPHRRGRVRGVGAGVVGADRGEADTLCHQAAAFQSIAHPFDGSRSRHRSGFMPSFLLMSPTRHPRVVYLQSSRPGDR